MLEGWFNEFGWIWHRVGCQFLFKFEEGIIYMLLGDLELGFLVGYELFPVFIGFECTYNLMDARVLS